MSADDQPEKSLFTRIKDCVLTELNRKRDEVPRSPCPARSYWGWTTGRKSEDMDKSAAEKAGVEGLRKRHSSSNEHGTGVEESSKLDSSESENHSDAIRQEEKEDRASAEKNDSAAEPNLSKPDKFEPRRYYIKMQDPEALPCCESLIPRKICPPKTRKPKPFEEGCEKYRRKPVCRCSGCAAADDHR